MLFRPSKNIFLPAVTLPFVLLAVAPLTFFFGNYEEYQGEFSEIVLFLVRNVGIGWGVCLALFWIFRRHSKTQNFLIGAVISLACCVWLQSQILVWDFGPLDGRGIDWSRWFGHSIAELGVWISVLSLGIWAVVRYPRLASTASQAIVTLGVLSIAASFLASDYKPKAVKQEGYEGIFTLHPQNNTILILLDCFQLDLFVEIMDQFPEDVEFLDGFTFFKNHVTGYPTTYANIPLMLTGRFYTNQEPIRDFAKRAYAESSVTDIFAKHGYVSDVVTMNHLVVDGLDVGPGIKDRTFRIVEQSSDSLVMLAMLVTDGGLFRAAPTFLKDRIYGDGDWFFSKMLREPDVPPGWHGTDVKFLRLFERLSNVKSKAEGTFKYYHFATPHPPYRINENLEYVSDGDDTRAEVISQSRGGLTIARRMLARLRKLGIYDSSEIVILSDHGTMTHVVEYTDDQIDTTNPTEGLPWYVHSSGMSLLLYKPKGSRGPLRTSNLPSHMSDVHCLLTNQFGESDDCSGHTEEMMNPVRIRPFYLYHWTKEYGDWSKDYLPPIQKYEVTGDALDPNSWRNTNIRYEQGASPDADRSNQIEFGVIYPFYSDDVADPYLGKGWSYPEPTHRWSDGPTAAMNFRLPDGFHGDLLLRLNASGFSVAGVVEFENVQVVANGVAIGSWQMQEDRWYEMRIPTDNLNDGALGVEFLISDPVAPCEISTSSDCRKLGIMARQFQLVAVPR